MNWYVICLFILLLIGIATPNTDLRHNIRRCSRTSKKSILLNEYHDYIVIYDEGIDINVIILDDHISRILREFKSVVVSKKLAGLFFGYGLTNATELVATFVQSLPGVSQVSKSKRFYASNVKSWGLDRIDQQLLPLDSKYDHDFDGKGVNIFVVDTGIDTNHIEFADNQSREVKNLFDVSYRKKEIPHNNDDVGHGTHVAATIGGNTVGVSPSANIYGVKVLDETGEGDDINVIDGISFIYNWYTANDMPPTVVSMSLGGECLSYEDCQSDIVIKAVQKLTTAGISVVVAAGNDDCDSCLSTPAYATSVITVGATTMDDDAAVFSDFGKCVDIYAPGMNITSACATSMCPTPNSYIALSGTSMACPHVTGVVAQLLQIHPSASPEKVSSFLSCLAVKNNLDILQDEDPAVTRNLLLQIPRKLSLKDMLCDVGEGCPGSCSGYGLCQSSSCLCDREHWGTNCSVLEYGKHCQQGYAFIEYTIWDTDGDSWQGSELRITHETSPPSSNDSDISSAGSQSTTSPTPTATSNNNSTATSEAILTTSMCIGYSDTSGVCLANHQIYQLSVTAGPTGGANVGWSICNFRGGAPYQIEFRVTSNNQCEAICRNGHFIPILLFSSSEEGWGGGTYQILDTTSGVAIAGGSLATKGFETHKICVKDNQEVVALFTGDISSSAAKRSKWLLCGVERSLVNDYLVFRTATSYDSLSGSSVTTCEIPPTHLISNCTSHHLLNLGLFDYSSVSQPKKRRNSNTVTTTTTTATISSWNDYYYTLSSISNNENNQLHLESISSSSNKSTQRELSNLICSGTKRYNNRTIEDISICMEYEQTLSSAATSTTSSTTTISQWRLGSQPLHTQFDNNITTSSSSSIMKENSGSIISQKTSFWISCGAKGYLGEQLRFRKDTTSVLGCQQDCLTLTTDHLPHYSSLQYLLASSDPNGDYLKIRTTEDNKNDLCFGRNNNNNTESVKCNGH